MPAQDDPEPTDYFSRPTHPAHSPLPPASHPAPPDSGSYAFCFPRTFSSSPPSLPPTPLSPHAFAHPPYASALEPSISLHRFLHPASSRGFRLPHVPPPPRVGGLESKPRPKLSEYQAYSHAYPARGGGDDGEGSSKPNTPFLSESSRSEGSDAAMSPGIEGEKRTRKKEKRGYTHYSPDLPSPTFRTYFPPAPSSSSASSSSHPPSAYRSPHTGSPHTEPSSLSSALPSPSADAHPPSSYHRRRTSTSSSSLGPTTEPSPTPLAEMSVFFRGAVMPRGVWGEWGPLREDDVPGPRRPRLRKRGASVDQAMISAGKEKEKGGGSGETVKGVGVGEGVGVDGKGRRMRMGKVKGMEGKAEEGMGDDKAEEGDPDDEEQTPEGESKPGLGGDDVLLWSERRCRATGQKEERDCG